MCLPMPPSWFFHPNYGSLKGIKSAMMFLIRNIIQNEDTYQPWRLKHLIAQDRSKAKIIRNTEETKIVVKDLNMLFVLA